MIAVAYLMIIYDGIRRLNKLETVTAMTYEIAILSLLLLPESSSLASLNLILQKILLAFVFSGLILMIIAIDNFGLAKSLCLKEVGEVSAGIL